MDITFDCKSITIEPNGYLNMRVDVSEVELYDLLDNVSPSDYYKLINHLDSKQFKQEVMDYYGLIENED